MFAATSPFNQGISDGDEAETPPTSEPSRPIDTLRRPPPAREKLATLDEEAFDSHDTIPAPPWLDDADAPEEPLFPAR